MMVDLSSLAQTLLEANERLLYAAFPDIEDFNTLNECDAIPRLAETARQLCAAGDEGVCHVMRSWLWDGILTMLVDAGLDLGLGGAEYEQRYADFVHGDGAPGLSVEGFPFHRQPE